MVERNDSKAEPLGLNLTEKDFIDQSFLNRRKKPSRLKLRDRHFDVFDKLSDTQRTFEELRTSLQKRTKITSNDLRTLLNELIEHGYVRFKKCVYRHPYKPKTETFSLYSLTEKAARRWARYHNYNNTDGIRTAPPSANEYIRKIRAKKMKKAIEQDNESMRYKCAVHEYWTIDVSEKEKKETYADLTVQADILGSDGRHVTYLKIVDDDGTSSLIWLARKVQRMTGTGIVLCPTNKRMRSLMNAFRESFSRGEEKIASDGVIFGLFDDFCSPGGGLLGITFRTLDEETLQFKPR